MQKCVWWWRVSALALVAASSNAFAASCGGVVPSSGEITIASGGATRTVAVHFGTGYDGRKPSPLVLDLHASGSNGAGQANISGLRAAADRHGFVVAWPEGSIRVPPGSDAHFWNIPGVPLAGGAPIPADARDDTKFIEDLVAHLTANACVDAGAVFATGLSGGARMGSHLACRLSDRIVGIAPVGGLRAGRASANDPAVIESDSCKPARPVAVMAFHGTDDAVNAYTGSPVPHWGYSVPIALESWAKADGCDVRAERQSVGDGVSRVSYRGCRANAVVELYLLETSREKGGGHTWPGSTAPVPDAMRANVGLPSRTLDATEIMSRFFDTYRRQ